MNHRASSISFLAVFLLFSAASAFNITKLLGQFSDFSNFNDLLTQTKLADEINKRETITILAVDNGAASSLSGKPIDVVKKILSVHVILDYYDVQKLGKLSSGNSTQLTTLFQTSGAAVDQQGFVKVSLINEGEVAFGSAVKGAPITAKLVKSVVSQPYNISVLQITTPIQIPNIDSKPSSPPPSPAPKKSPAPSAETPSSPPAQAKEPAAAPVADTPESDSPKSDSPTAESPKIASSPPKPADTADDAGAPGPGASSATSVKFVGFSVMMMGLISLAF